MSSFLHTTARSWKFRGPLYVHSYSKPCRMTLAGYRCLSSCIRLKKKQKTVLQIAARRFLEKLSHKSCFCISSIVLASFGIKRRKPVQLVSIICLLWTPYCTDVEIIVLLSEQVYWKTYICNIQWVVFTRGRSCHVISLGEVIKIS